MNTLEQPYQSTSLPDDDPYTDVGYYDPDTYGVYNLFHTQSNVLSPKNISQHEINLITEEGSRFNKTGIESPARRELSCDAFDYAFIQYVAISGINGPDEPLTYAITPHDVLSEFSISRPKSGLNRILKNASLVEALGANDNIPDQTVAIPVAINKEDLSTVIEAINKLIKSQSNSSQLTEILVWANARFDTDEDESDCRNQAEENYMLLRRALDELQKDGSRIQIKTALQIEQAENMTMSKIRQSLMDSIIFIGHKQRRGFNYPVTWLDADTKEISALAIDNISMSARRLEGPAIHANLRFDSGAEESRELGVDDSERALGVRELLRRKVERQYYMQKIAKGEKTKVLGYAEESGLCLPLGTTMMTGGTNIKQPVDESVYIFKKKHIQDNMPFVFGGIVSSRSIVQKYLLGTPLQYTMTPDLTPDEESERYRHADTSTPLLNIDDKITTSARSLVLNVRDYGIDGLINPHAGNYKGLFNDRIINSTENTSVPSEGVDLDTLVSRLLQEDKDIAFMHSTLQPSTQNAIKEEIQAIISRFQK